MSCRFSRFRKALVLTSCAFSLGLVWSPAQAAKQIPPPPRHYVLDEPQVLDATSKRALESLLIEHDHATGEQFLIAVFDSLEGEDPVDFTNRLFTRWGIGKRGKDTGVLLALYWKEHKSRIEVGYGLESLLTDAKSKLILSQTVAPELRNGNAARALALGSLEILRILESPLIANGKAQEILRSGGFQGRFRPERKTSGGWTVWLVLGFILCVIVFNLLTSAEAHFTGSGWYRPHPMMRRRWWRGGGSSGGFGGSWGGGGRSGGGFIGGGGSSGGGGATGDW